MLSSSLLLKLKKAILNENIPVIKHLLKNTELKVPLNFISLSTSPTITQILSQTSSIHFSKSLHVLDLRKIFDSYLTNLYLEKAIIQPQGMYYSLKVNKKPNNKLIKFLSDENNVPLLGALQTFENDYKNTQRLNKAILNTKLKTGCFFPFHFQSIPVRKEVHNNIAFDLEILGNTRKYIPKSIDYPSAHLINISMIDNIASLKECVKNTNYISISAGIFINKQHSKIKLKNDVSHAIRLVIDLSNRSDIRMLSLESDISGTKEKYTRMEKTLSYNFTRFFGNIIGYTIRYITFEEEGCPLFSIQGTYKTCVLWSVYLFYAYMLNEGNRSKVYKSLYKVKNKYRNRVLSQFVYYTSSIIRIDPNIYTIHPKGKMILRYLRDSWN